VGTPFDDRTKRLLEWERAPMARESHPTEDHLVPLLVALGAAEHEAAVRTYLQPDFMGTVTSASYRFGAGAGAALAA
jgi:aromatic ring-opening dioxygenase catalytic subunit (LigB family)